METIETEPTQRGRRPVLLATAFVLVLLLLAITPPLLNVSRYQRRIVASMSESLGRPVHLDRVSLHLLPMPGFTFENLVVSEDPAFGNEPTIRANEVVATLRVSSLWKRRVEFSEVKFEQPSVNLVRNAQGRWNLEAVLLHASRVDTAPTAQAKAGPEPRFPYIEATGGRINLKLGEQKMPFSLTDADFALWLPSPQVWRVRLEGKPRRTDSNIGDPGTVRVEGTLERAAHMEEVPVNLHASWYAAPLGEASKLVSGNDRGWRGTLHADLFVQGPLGDATMKAGLTFDELRRADFVPGQSLDESVSCSGKANLPAVEVTNLTCTVPVADSASLELTSPAVDLSRPAAAEASVAAKDVPLQWVFQWLRLFSARIPPQPAVQGTVDAQLAHAAESPLSDWTGTAGLTIPVAQRRPNGELVAKSAAASQSFSAELSSNGGMWSAVMPAATIPAAAVPAATIQLGPGAELSVSAQASAAGYSFTATGDASAAQLATLTHAFPQIADGTGLASITGTAANTVRPIALLCTRVLAGGQTCAAPPPPLKKPVKRKARRY